MNCIHKEQSSSLYLGEYSSRVGQTNMLDAALLPPIFFLFLGGIGTLGSRAVSLAPLKSQAQKKSEEQKLKIALHISGTQKVPECSLFTLTETYTNCFLGRHSEWKESYSSLVHPCLYRGLGSTSLKAQHGLLMPFC